ARQGAGDPPIHVWVDDLSLGSWLTPVISSVVPGHVAVWATTPVTVTGANFMPLSTIRIGSAPASGVQWVDEYTLRANVPVSLMPGVYDVTVSNPSGQESILPSGLRVGIQLYLPLIMH